MSRGKYRRRRQHRDEQTHAAAVATLQADIAAEDQHLHSARDRAQAAAAARARLQAETDLARRRLAPLEDDAQQAAHRVGQPWQRLRSALTDLRRVDDRLTPTADSPRRAAAARARHALAAGIRITAPDIHRSAPDGYLRYCYRTRLGAGEPETTLSLQGWIPDATPTDRDSLARYALSTPHDTTPQAGWSWAVPPWLNLPDGTDAPRLRAALGATTTGTPTQPATPYPGRGLPAGATITLPWRPRPLIDHPTDAADLAHWYQRSSWAQHWPGATPPIPHCTHAPNAPDPAVVGDASAGGAAADLNAQLVPFWVPGDYCAAFPAARPLPPGTVLRLPFPTVFACFATPWTLPPHPEPELDAGRGSSAGAAHRTRTAEWPYTAMLHGRGRAHHGAAPTLETVLLPLQAAVTDRAELPTPLQVAAELGTHIDGLILTAHPDGTPRDEFAWCLSIPHPWGTTLARIVVPASRRRTAWRDQIDNMIAAIALSAWHPTDHEPEPRPAVGEPTPCPSAEERAGIAVRILDIDATTTQHPATRPGHATVRQSHLRRGHWRRQRVGASRAATRWTWVRPTTVNPTGAPTAAQVYRLPAVSQT